MRFGETARDLSRDVDRFFGRKRTVLQALLERRAVEPFHDEVDMTVDRASEIDALDDVRMIDASDRLGFALEAGDRLSIVGESPVEHLDRDAPPRVDVFGLVDLTHRAFADLLDQAIAIAHEVAEHDLADESASVARTERRIVEAVAAGRTRAHGAKDTWCIRACRTRGIRHRSGGPRPRDERPSALISHASVAGTPARIVVFTRQMRKLLVVPVLLVAAPAAAHIALVYPPPRTTELKTGPCGAVGSARGTNVTVLAPGAAIDVKWNETINHPGHYRISFDPIGQDFTVPLAFDDTSQTKNVLVDNITDNPNPGASYTQTITLPNLECETCTLQVIQVMTDKPPYGDGNDIYFQCADIALRIGAPGPPDVGVGDPAGGDAGVDPGAPATIGGGCQATSGTPGVAAAALMVVLGRRARRRR